MFCGNDSDNELADPAAAVATICADETVTTLPMVSVSVACPVPLPFVALSVTVDVPAAVGVPEINPEEVLTDSPPGKPVAP